MILEGVGHIAALASPWAVDYVSRIRDFVDALCG
jgi:hypothetical protein